MRSVKLNRMKLWQKLAILVAAMSLPATVVGYFYLTAATGALQQARSELAGTAYLSAIGRFNAAVLEYESRSFVLASGDAARAAAVQAAATAANSALANLQRVNARLGLRYGVRRDLQAIQAHWSALTAPSARLTATHLIQANQRLLARTARLRDAVAAGARATSDPDQRSHSLVQVATVYGPAALAAQAALRRYAVDAAAKGYLGGGDRMGIVVAHDQLQTELAAIADALTQVPPRVRTSLARELLRAGTASARFYAVVSRQILNAGNIQVSAATLYDRGAATNVALNRLLSDSATAAADTLAARVSALRLARTLNITLALLAIVLIHVLTWSAERSFTHPLRHAAAVFKRIAAGHYDNVIDTDRRDELGQVLGGLSSMQDKLRVQLANERMLAAENARIRQALDKTSTGVLVADSSQRIVYLNQAARTGFARHAREFASVLSGFDAEKLQGAPLDGLATHAAIERQALEALRSERIEDRDYGGLHFRVTTNPVLNRDGVRLGTVMEWKERTQEVRVEQEMQEVLRAVTSGDLTRRIALADKSGFFAMLGSGVNTLADGLAEIVARVKVAAREIFLGAEEITTGNSNLSTRTEEQASSLEQTASSMEEMTTTVKQNADNAAQANQLAIAAREQAEQGVTVVDKAVRAMTGIDDSAQKIADIIGVIDAIAFQTNLLALNAAVEAARAGEQGRGFAVVASEVRNLAGRSATAAQEIKTLIHDSVTKVTDGAQLVTESGKTLAEIVSSVKKVSDIVAEIAAASREQFVGIEQVNRSVLQMDHITQQNAALVEQTIAASQIMAAQVRDLNETLARFRLAGAAPGNAATPAANGPSPAASAVSRQFVGASR